METHEVARKSKKDVQGAIEVEWIGLIYTR